MSVPAVGRGRTQTAPAGAPDDILAAASDLERLTELARYDVLDPRLRPRLDAIAESSRDRLGQPVALVTVVLDNAQFVLGSAGLSGWIVDARGTPVEWSFCAHAVAAGDTYTVSDAATDPRQAGNPLVTVDGIRSYLGVPLVTGTGQVLGAHCVVGFEPHLFRPSDVAVLNAAADDVMRVLEEFRRH